MLKRILKIGAIFSLVAIVLAFALASVAFAADNSEGACYGESSEGEGSELHNHWGNAEAGSGICLGMGAGYGESSEGEGPELHNHWGNAEAGSGICLGMGAGYGESSEEEGPELHNQWGKSAHAQ